MKNLENIKSGIIKIKSCRGTSSTPFLSVSLVVTRSNIHEVTDFIMMADHLNVDRVHIRPLSEIASSTGTIEDIRSIVPYENEIHTLNEEIEDFINDIRPKCEVIFNYATFKSLKQNPLSGIIPIKGFENQLIPPNRRYWHYDSKLIFANWHLNTLNLEWSQKGYAVFRSDAIPVQNNKLLKLPFGIRIENGSIEISINGVDNRCIVQKIYRSEVVLSDHHADIYFNTEENDRVRISIRGTAGSKVKLSFEKLRSYPLKIDRFALIKDFNKWEKNSEKLDCQYLKDGFKIGWKGAKYVYLLKSYGIPCYAHEVIQLDVEMEIEHGELGIGILSEDGAKWISTFRYPAGHHFDVLQFDSGENLKFHIVFYAHDDERLLAAVKWKHFKDIDVKTSANSNALIQDSVNCEQAPKNNDKLFEAKMPNGDQLKQNEDKIEKDQYKWSLSKAKCYLEKFLKKRSVVYCQKPWTDLSNFTVDGRMDVCCITTGESQKKYSLGNIFESDFQEIWNGTVAQKFRSTVNDRRRRLPPCSRCPMAFQRQGLFFDAEFTKGYLKRLVRVYLITEVTRISISSLHFARVAARKILMSLS